MYVFVARQRSEKFSLVLLSFICGLESLIHEWRISCKKTPLCSKGKVRDVCATHEVTRNAYQLYNTTSSISTQKIRFARPKGDSTFIQTSRSHKLLNPLCQLSLAICSKRSPRSVLTIVWWKQLFTLWWANRCFDCSRFFCVKRVVRARWGVFVLQEFEFFEVCWLVWKYKNEL
jgi:hypothetical protein